MARFLEFADIQPRKSGLSLDDMLKTMGISRAATVVVAAALVLARELRRAGLRIEVGDGSFRIKKSFETGDKLARNIVLLGEDEVQSGMLTVKNFAIGEQTKVPRENLAAALTPPHE